MSMQHLNKDHNWYCDKSEYGDKQCNYKKCKKCSHLIFNTVYTVKPHKFYNSNNSCFKIPFHAPIPSCKELMMRKALD